MLEYSRFFATNRQPQTKEGDSMEATYLPGNLRNRIKDLLKQKGMTQAELAQRIGGSGSSLSRFLSSKTDKLGDENLLRIARVFNVSTDFLLGETDIPDRMNYDIAELGLSAQAARNLYANQVHKHAICALLENPRFGELSHMLARFFMDFTASGYAVQNQYVDVMSSMVDTFTKDNPDWSKHAKEAKEDLKALKVPVYQADLTMIQNTFMSIVKEIKKELGSNLPNQKAPLRAVIDKIYAELPKDQNGKMQKPTAESVTQATGIAIQKLTGMQPKNQEALSAIFLDIFTAEYEKTLEDAHEQ